MTDRKNLHDILSSAEVREISQEIEGFGDELEDDPTWERLHNGGKMRRKLSVPYGDSDYAPS